MAWARVGLRRCGRIRVSRIFEDLVRFSDLRNDCTSVGLREDMQPLTMRHCQLAAENVTRDVANPDETHPQFTGDA